MTLPTQLIPVLAIVAVVTVLMLAISRLTTPYRTVVLDDGSTVRLLKKGYGAGGWDGSAGDGSDFGGGDAGCGHGGS